MRVAKAEIRWIPVSEGGRAKPFRGNIYSSVSTWGGELRDASAVWSAVLELEGKPDASGTQQATIRFLVPDAPQHLIKCGARFALFEVDHKTVEGRVVSEPSEEPWRPGLSQRQPA
jgi:hypothetical protein